jgi:pantetheine-phosphate adenylyltransferase
MKRIAVFPGSFDPFTIGHEYIVKRALPLFDEIVIAVGSNSTKTDFISFEKRVELIKQVFTNEPKIRITGYSGLTVDFCKREGANHIIRGLRTSADFEYERAIAQVNKVLNADIETIFLLTAPEHSAITSTLVREVIRNNGDTSKFLPQGINIKSYLQ